MAAYRNGFRSLLNKVFCPPWSLIGPRWIVFLERLYHSSLCPSGEIRHHHGRQRLS